MNKTLIKFYTILSDVIYFVSDLQTSGIYKHVTLIKFYTILSDVIYFVSDLQTSGFYKHVTLIKFYTILSDVILLCLLKVRSCVFISNFHHNPPPLPKGYTIVSLIIN
jgi:hypothetical protein